MTAKDADHQGAECGGGRTHVVVAASLTTVARIMLPAEVAHVVLAAVATDRVLFRAPHSSFFLLLPFISTHGSSR